MGYVHIYTWGVSALGRARHGAKWPVISGFGEVNSALKTICWIQRPKILRDGRICIRKGYTNELGGVSKNFVKGSYFYNIQFIFWHFDPHSWVISGIARHQPPPPIPEILPTPLPVNVSALKISLVFKGWPFLFERQSRANSWFSTSIYNFSNKYSKLKTFWIYNTHRRASLSQILRGRPFWATGQTWRSALSDVISKNTENPLVDDA